MKKYNFLIIIFSLFFNISCTKIGLQLDNNIVTPISVVGNVNKMVFDSINPLKICISSSIRARGVNYEWAYTSTDGGIFYKDKLMKEPIAFNTYSSIQRGDTQLVYYVPQKISVNGVRNSLSFFVKNTFNGSQTLLYKINANVSQAPSDKPIIIGPKDSTLQDNNDNSNNGGNNGGGNNGDDGYLDPDDPNTDWNVYGKRDTVGAGDFVYILGRNFQQFATKNNTDIKINGRSIGKDSITIIADTSIQIIVPPNLYPYFVDTMKLSLAIRIDLSAEGKGIVQADFTGSKFAPVWRPTYFLIPFNKTLPNPNDITIDTNTNLMFVCSSENSIYYTINMTTPNTISNYNYGKNIVSPYGIAIDENNLYITSYQNNNASVFKMEKLNGSAQIYLSGLNNPFDILISNDKNSVFVYNENPSRVYQTNVNIMPTDVINLTPLYTLTQGNNLPAGIAINKKNEFFISFSSNNTIIKILPDGTQSTIAGQTNVAGYAGNKTDASSSILNNPYKILSDNYNSLFFTDNKNKAVRIISAFSNRIYTIGGDPLHSGTLTPINLANNIKATLVLFDNPTAISMDKENNIYIINENIYKLELR